MQDVLKKMHFREPGIVLNAPPAMENALVKLGFATSFPKTKSRNTLVFFHNEKELTAFLKNSLKSVEPDSVLWFAYPKGSSKIKTDINRDSIRESAGKFGLATVTAVSIDDTWSGLRFRPLDKVGT